MQIIVLSLGVIVWIKMGNKIMSFMALQWESLDYGHKIWSMNNLNNYFGLIIMGA